MVPRVFARLSVACFLTCYTLVDNVVLSYLHVALVNAHVVLVVLFVLIEREVLVDVFNIGRSLVGRTITFRRVFRIDRVAVRIVNVLITV